MDEQQRRLAEELLFSTEKKPSFAAQLYFGIFDSSHVLPYPHPKTNLQEQESTDQFLTQLKEFADQHIDANQIDRQAEIPEDLIKGLGKLGLLGATIPKTYAGLEMSQYGYCRAMECIAEHCGATALFLNAHQSIGLKALLLFGTEEQRKKWLPRLASGEQLAAFSLTEENAGSDASAVETTAVFDPVKNVYRITGKKQWTTNGSIAKVLTVMAKTEVETPQGKQNKITAFLVTPDMPGFIILNPNIEKVGMRGSKTANLQFNQVEVPPENILGPLGGGLKVCLTVLDYGRTTFGATCTGAAKILVEKAIQHARTRHQFKRPLSSFPLVKKKIATMAALLYAMEATTYLTAGLVDSGMSDFMLEAAMLKVFNSESLWWIIYETMQIYGGRSFFTDEPLERMMRDARLNMIGEGSNEVLRAFIGVVGMRDVGVHLKEGLDALKHPIDNRLFIKKFLKQTGTSLFKPKIPIKSAILLEETRRLEVAVQRFGFAVKQLLKAHRENILEKQLALDRIATSAIALYTTTAVLSKIDSALVNAKGNFQSLGNDVSVAKLYCKQALDQLDCALIPLFRNEEDHSLENVSDLLTKKR